MNIYATHHNMSEAEREHRRREIEFDTLIKEMEEYQACLLISVKTLRRNGPSKNILKRIDDFGSEFTSRLHTVMEMANSGHYRLEGPTRR
jgi:hypothetical protein